MSLYTFHPVCGACDHMQADPHAEVCEDCGSQLYPQPPTRRKRDPLASRHGRHGAIVCFRNAAGETLNIHREGTTVQAVREACAIALGMDETARVLSISTPQSIYTDLRGRTESSHTRTSEAALLRRAGFPGLASSL